MGLGDQLHKLRPGKQEHLVRFSAEARHIFPYRHEPKHPPVKKVQGAPSWGIKRQELELNQTQR
jgi:hypothetical protein